MICTPTFALVSDVKDKKSADRLIKRCQLLGTLQTDDALLSEYRVNYREISIDQYEKARNLVDSCDHVDYDTIYALDLESLEDDFRILEKIPDDELKMLKNDKDAYDVINNNTFIRRDVKAEKKTYDKVDQWVKKYLDPALDNTRIDVMKSMKLIAENIELYSKKVTKKVKGASYTDDIVIGIETRWWDAQCVDLGYVHFLWTIAGNPYYSPVIKVEKGLSKQLQKCKNLTDKLIADSGKSNTNIN